MKSKMSVIKFGGISLILAGVLFFAQYLFVLPMPGPPLPDTELMTWLQEWRFNLSMADELMFFATICLIPSIVGLYQVLVKVDTIQTMLGCGLLSVVIPINLVLVIVLGRLVYPVYNIELSPDIYKLVISEYYGGVHLVALLFSIATIILCLAIRKSVMGKPAAYIGLVVGILDLIGAFPWLIGTAMILVTQLFFSAWFVILGVRLYKHVRPTL
ncbi:hypothetical protein [Paenibacillus sp. sgz5001063]|uniref:hypothetical protein n=1 Tax=Paenibacillus sp. sgz5001063 TaxID=3242474 RepID=UPI0036D402A2